MKVQRLGSARLSIRRGTGDVSLPEARKWSSEMSFQNSKNDSQRVKNEDRDAPRRRLRAGTRLKGSPKPLRENS